MKRKIHIVGIVGLPARYGGFETLVDNLVKNFDHSSFDIVVYCSKKPRIQDLPKTYNGATLTYVPFKANGWQSIIYDAYSLIYGAFNKADVLLILGVSGAIVLPLIRIFSRSSIVVNLDGVESRRQKWGYFAKIFLKLSELLAVRFSHGVIVDNQGIFNYILKEYQFSATTIAYGADHCDDQGNSVLLTNLNLPFSPYQYNFSVCRIEPENNVDMILDAHVATNKNIIFVGNWNDSAYGSSLKRAFDQYDNVCLLDPIYDQAHLNSLRRYSNIYVHGHMAGGTNPSLVEAMYLGSDLVAYDCDFNRYTTRFLANYFSDSTALQKLLVDDNIDNGNQMKDIARHHYTWNKITAQYVNLIDSCLTTRNEQ